MASLYSAHVVAGFDPEAFWHLTPRQLVVRLKAAAQRQAQLQALAAEAAWMGAHAEKRDLEKYKAALRGEDLAMPPEALAGMMRAASRGLPEVTWAEILKQRG